MALTTDVSEDYVQDNMVKGFHDNIKYYLHCVLVAFCG